MPVQTPKPPNEVEGIARQELERLRSTVPPEEGDRTRFSLGEAYPIFTGTLPAFVEGNGLETATLSAWRQLLSLQQTPIATMDVSVGKEGTSYRFSNLNHGPFVEGIARSLALAERSPRVETGDYDPRLLHVPALYLVALWLRGIETAEDILIPVAPAPDPLMPNQEYSAQEFAQAVAEIARARLAQTDDTKGA